MSHRKPARLPLFALSLALLSTPAVAQTNPTPPAQGLFFFEGAAPPEISAQNGTVSVSDLRFKDGKSSLRWQFQPGGQLVVNAPLSLGQDDPITPRAFWLWVYNLKAVEGNLTFAFGAGERAEAQFSAPLNFTGWRGIAIPYRDMQGKVSSDTNRLTVTAPAQAGEVFLDQLMLNVPLDNRTPVPDRMFPFVNPSVNTAVNKNWNGLLMYDEMLRRNLSALNFAPAFDDKSGDTAGLYTRAEEALNVAPPLKVAQDAYDKALRDFAAFGIRQEADGRIVGPMLEFPTHLESVKVGVFPEDTVKYLTTGAVNLRALGTNLLQMARFLRSPDLSDTQRADLQSRFLLATRYVLDQGFTAGSGYQVIHHLGYQSRELFDAWFLNRQLLNRAGLLPEVAQTMIWYSGTGQVFTPAAQLTEANVDILNTQLQWMIKGALLLPDQAQRAKLLSALRDWLSMNILVSGQGIVGGFKPDGSVFHHGQHYVAYALDAYNGMSPAVYILSQSPFAIAPVAKARLDANLYQMSVNSKGTMVPLILSGRHPNDRFKLGAPAFKWLALSGNPSNGEKVNALLAGTYARLAGQPDFMGVSALPEPTGSWAMNYAGMSVQRRADPANSKRSWLAIARGLSRYLVGNESYAENNLYGRYMLYGGLQIIPADPTKYNYSHDGWDWNRYPGTTSVVLPFEDLKAKLTQLPAAGVEEMLLSTETYAGANALNGNSMYAMKLRGHAKYAQDSLRANKSYFMFDNRVVALGSGIQDDDAQHETVTTLFQHSVPKAEAVLVSGKSVNTAGEQQLSGAATLTDPAGNTYFIPAGQDIHLTYGPQTSPDDMKSTPTQGNFATAWLRHGKAPKDATYEYAVAIGSQAAPQYTVLSHTPSLHAVRDGASGQEGYAFFEAGSASGGVVKASSAPNMVMTAPTAGSLQVSVVNPDLALYSGTEADQVGPDGKQAEVSVYSRQWWASRSQPQTSTVTLAGNWTLAGNAACAKVEASGGDTLLTVTTTDAKPCVVTLKP